MWNRSNAQVIDQIVKCVHNKMLLDFKYGGFYNEDEKSTATSGWLRQRLIT